MLKKVGVNVVWCVTFLLAVGVVTCPPLAGVGGGVFFWQYSGE